MNKCKTGQVECPICGVGELMMGTTNSFVEYKGAKHCIPLHFCVCSYCETEQATEQQLLENKMEMIALKERYAEHLDEHPDL